MNKKIRVFKNISDIYIKGTNTNILFIMGLSGSGKSYLSKLIAKETNKKIFQVEWLIHYKHCDMEFKQFLDEFINKYDIRKYVDDKWNNEKNEDDNNELKKYINLLLEYFMDTYKDKGEYIIEGLQLFTMIDYELIRNYPIVIKGTSSINSLKNRIKRDYQKRKNYKFKDKVVWIFNVLKQSKLYQFKHRKKLNELIKKI